MEATVVARAIRAATSVACTLDLPADGAIVLHSSNRLALRLTPCDVLARVSPVGQLVAAQLELERALRLAEAGCPVGAVHPHVEPAVYTRDGFAVTLWVYHESVPSRVSAVDYAGALQRLHAGMREVDMATPWFTDRIADAEQVATDPDLSPELVDADRVLLERTLRSLRRRIAGSGAAEQLLHGEPHPGNLLGTKNGPLFVDFETVCGGPVEFDLAHVPEAVCEHYPDVNRELLDDCRQLVLAMVAAWRWRLGDEFPDRRRWGKRFLRSLRDGPPWPTLDTMTSRFDAS
jgi:aminoglycoside phosphotransferase (APT) family kinase protein